MRSARLVATLTVVGVAAVPAAATGGGDATQVEGPSDALARNVRILSAAPRHFNALLGAGKAALELGDAQAAAGFYGRAGEVNSSSPHALIGMGAAIAAAGDPRKALGFFSRAQRLGASPASIGCERGLAFDLLGQFSAAQSDYRSALSGPAGDEARRRLALSLAISGDRSSALEALQPLLDRSDRAARRTHVLVLALTGDLAETKAALGSTLPGGWHQMEPFFRRLMTLSTAEKAAAVHLGIFPGSGLSIAAADGDGEALASLDASIADQPYTDPVPGPMQYGAARGASIQPQAQTPRPPLPGPMAYGVATVPPRVSAPELTGKTH